MPHSIASCGLIPGILLLVFSGLLSIFGLYLLSRCASLCRPARSASFALLAKMTYPRASIGFDSAIAIKCAGVACSYLIIIGSLMPSVILSFDRHPPAWLLDRGLWIVASTSILTPLCYSRQLHSLRFTSYISLLVVFDLILVVVYKFCTRAPLPPSSPTHVFVLDTSIVSSIPVYIFAFTCAQNLFSCFNELTKNGQKRMNAVTGISIGSATLIYELIGVLAYLTFGAEVPSNVMTAYHDSLFVNICRAGIVIFILFSYPLQILPCRASLSHLFNSPDTPFKHVLLTTFILLLTFLIAMNVTELALVMGIIGSTGSTTVSFILPSLFYLKLFPDNEWKGVRILARALFVMGFVIMFACLGVVIYHGVTGH
ncbi:MAG: hypothetical protein CYPHOPRED_004545 [Cyphobasidiales sp. Tagirdzhanova-0007]|nr:MAG: hypothetical protein CYPHOPRED_004545 [Cyphobasidiales sp. Tagirdzhanova-0007]